MTQEEKQLLLKDLCARMPYGVKVHVGDDWAMTLRQIDYKCFCECWENEYLKNNSRWMLPYLRPMSSMTEEEREELEHLSEEYFGKALDKQIQESLSSSNRNESKILECIASSVIVDWLNAHHFDFRGLIEKGLALEAPEGMYK